jgi:superfamily II DNA or RNA helicase
MSSPGQLPLRPYQREALAAIHEGYEERKISRPLVVLPTGAGKTVVFAHLARLRAQSGRTLIIAHREELLTQAADKLMRIAPDLMLGVVKAERDDHHFADVIIASIQTIARPKRIAPLVGTISTVVVDEAHHATAQTYRDALTALGCFDDGGPLTVGVTATAGRGDGIGLGAVWQEIVYQRGIIHMIAEGYLVDVRGLEVMTDLDYQRLKTNRGDYTDTSLGLEMDRSGVIEAAAVAYEKYAKDRRGVAFTPTIATAEELAKELLTRGIKAEHLSGLTERHERRAILRRLSSGETQVVVNCAVLTEGFDEPALSCALIARPTKSRPLFTQMAGRVLRPHPDKDDGLILNLFAPPEAGLATIADLAGLDLGTKLKVKQGESLAQAVAREEEERSRVLNGRRTSSVVTAKQVNLFARSALHWLPASTGFVLPCAGTSLLLVPVGDDLWDVVESANKTTRTISSGLTLNWAQGVGEEYARANGGSIARSDAAWRKNPVTDSQKVHLKKLGLPIPATRGEASDAMSAAWNARTISKLASGA